MKKKLIRVLLFVCLGIFALTGCGGGADEPGISSIDWNNHDKRAEQFLTALVNGDYSTAMAGFDETMQKGLSVTALRRNWEAMIQGAGAYVSISEIMTEPHDEYDIYIVVSRHEVMGVSTRIVFSHDGLVAGLFFTFVENSGAEEGGE